jgi:hypothetical protein
LAQLEASSINMLVVVVYWRHWEGLQKDKPLLRVSMPSISKDVVVEQEAGPPLEP